MILDALSHARRLEQEYLHLQELGISTLSALYVNSQSDPKKSQRATPRDFQYFAPRDHDVEIPSRVADAFLSLVVGDLLPGWSLEIVPIEAIRKAKRGSAVARPRAWVGEGVLLLLPQIAGEAVLCAMSILDGVLGTVSVTDVDTGAVFLIDIPTDERQWCLDAELYLLQGN